jgi:hypothetical protein
MLKKVLSISGKPGLYKLISQSKATLIAEALSDGRRLPVHSSDKVVSLGDVSMFTNEGEAPLREVFNAIKAKENGQKCSVDPKANPEDLKNFLGEILPDFDREKVYPSDIKKLISWYNILIEAGMTDFEPEKEEEKEEVEAETKEEEA